MTAATAEGTATEFAAELRRLADRVERATSWAALRESLDALTPTLRSTRGRVVRHTRAPKISPAERPAPAPKAEPKPEPVTAAPEPKPAPTAADAKRPPSDRGPSSRRREPHGGMASTVLVRCPGTLRVVVLGLLLSLWWTTGAMCRDAGRRLRRRYRDVTRPIRWAIGDAVEWAAWARDRVTAHASATVTRVVSALRRRS